MTNDEKIALLAIHGFRCYTYRGVTHRDNYRAKRGRCAEEYCMSVGANGSKGIFLASTLAEYEPCAWPALDTVSDADIVRLIKVSADD